MTRGDRPHLAAGLAPDRLCRSSPTRRSSAATRSRTSRASTRTACSRSARPTRSWTPPPSGSRPTRSCSASTRAATRCSRRWPSSASRLTGQALNTAFKRFKEIADKKKQVTAMDLEALVTDELREEIAGYTLEWFDVEASSRRPPHATVGVRTPDGEEVTGSFTGDGPVDAIFRAINAATGVDARLREFRVDAVTGGQDALGETSVVLEVGGVTGSGQGVSTDILEAAGRAYVRALSNAVRRRSIMAEEAEAATAQAAAEPVSGRRSQRHALPVAGGQHPDARLAVHEVRAHRRRALGGSGPPSGRPRRGGAGPAPRSTPRSGRRCGSTPACVWLPAMLAVGFRHRTWVSRPAGAASRLVGLHTPPSTYSRPPIRPGANSQGTRARRRHRLGRRSPRGARAPNTTRRPLTGGRRRRRAGGRRSGRPERVDAACAGPSSVSWGRGRRRSSAARSSAPPGAAEPEGQRRERRAGGERPGAGAAGGADRGHVGQAARRGCAPASSSSVPTAGGPARASCRPPGARRRSSRPRCPTKYSQSRRSKPVASSIPASTPIIQASPSTPPPPSTRTSGTGDHAPAG